jgi:hypothetical protein
MGKQQKPKDKPMKTRPEAVERVAAEYQVYRLEEGQWNEDGEPVKSLGRKALAEQIKGQFKLRRVA